MSLIARIEVGPPPGKAASEAVPEMVLDVEDVRADADDRWQFVFWASGGDFAAYEDALAADETVASFKRLTSLPDKRLYRIVLSPAAQRRTLHPTTIELDITIITLTITAGREEIYARFPSRDALLAYRDACREHGRNFELRTLYEESPDESRRAGTGRFGVTEAQREALLHALDRGYFGIPRETTMDALAADLDISTTAFSTRLRRGQQALLRNTLARDSI